MPTVIENFHRWLNSNRIIIDFVWSEVIEEWGNPRGPHKVKKLCEYLQNNNKTFIYAQNTCEAMDIYNMYLTEQNERRDRIRQRNQIINETIPLTIHFKEQELRFNVSNDITDIEVETICKYIKDVYVSEEPLPLYTP